MERRRRRPALSCVSCRKSKIRCDRNMPCGACVRSKHRTCVFDPQIHPSPRQSDMTSTLAGPLHQADSSHDDRSNFSLTGTTPADSSSSQTNTPTFDVKSLLDRIRELERRLEESTQQSTSTKNVTRASTTSSEPVATYPSYLAGELHTMNKSVMSKTRYFGQSHWMNQVGSVCCSYALTPFAVLYLQYALLTST